MALLDQIRAEMLIKLARERYAPNLTDAELNILRNSASSVDMDESEPESPWPAISAEFLRWLATDPDAASQIDPKGIRVIGVKVSGDLDLEGCRIAVSLTFCWCVIQGEIELASAETQGIFLLNSELSGGISAGRVKIRGPLFLDESNISGEVFLVGAQIDGQLSCFGARLCSKAERIWAERGIDQFDNNDSNLTGQPGNRDALSADGAEIGGDVFLSNEFLSTGTIRLTSVLIHGDLNCTSASLLGRKRGHALTANRAEIRGTVFLNGQFKSASTVSLIGAHINGDLDCGKAKLVAKEGVALIADRAEIGGTVFLNRGFESSGAVRFSWARIKGELDLCGAKLRVTQGDALAVEFAKIEGGILFGTGFECTGPIKLLNAQVGEQVAFIGAKVAEVDCTNLSLSGDLHWTKIDLTAATEVKLAGARVRNLYDDRKSWPLPEKLVLAGFVYEDLTLLEWPPREDSENNPWVEKPALKADDRVEWLMLQPCDRRIESQPWIHLSKYLQAKGDREGAKRVLYKLRCLQAQQKRLVSRRWAIAFAWLEEAPWRILYSIAITLLLGTLIFAGASRSGAIIPSALVLTSTDDRTVSNRYPPFQPFIYTLENAMPLVKLGMDDKWMLDVNHAGQTWFPENPSLDWLRVLNSYWFLAISRWVLILSGWFQATVLVAALSGRFKE